MKHKNTTTPKFKTAFFPFLKTSLCLCVFVFQISGCARRENTSPQPQTKSNRVVLYCSVDDVYARPIIRDLEKQTGLKIDVLYDTEAAKTAGLANRIRAEKSRPQGDVFWSSALLQTLLLSREGLLQPYVSPFAKDIPQVFKAKDGSWTGLGVRPRLMVYNTQIKEQPSYKLNSLWLLAKPIHKNKIGISNPQFGTASDWATALCVRWGKEKTLEYFRALKKNGVRVLPGNSVVAQKVANGEISLGITDLDDYLATQEKSKSIDVASVQIDQTIMVPGTVCVLKKAPHSQAARRLIDALLALQNEIKLSATMPGMLPIRDPKSQVPDQFRFAFRLPGSPGGWETPDDTAKWAGAWDEIREPLAEILLKD